MKLRIKYRKCKDYSETRYYLQQKMLVVKIRQTSQNKIFKISLIYHKTRASVKQKETEEIPNFISHRVFLQK